VTGIINGFWEILILLENVASLRFMCELMLSVILFVCFVSFLYCTVVNVPGSAFPKCS